MLPNISINLVQYMNLAIQMQYTELLNNENTGDILMDKAEHVWWKLNEDEKTILKSAGIMPTCEDVIQTYNRILEKQVYPELAKKLV